MTYKYNETLAEAYVQMVEEAKTPTYDSDLHKELVDHVKHIITMGNDGPVYNDKRVGGVRSLNAGGILRPLQKKHIDNLSEYGVTTNRVKSEWVFKSDHDRIRVPAPTQDQIDAWESKGKPSLGRPYGIGTSGENRDRHAPKSVETRHSEDFGVVAPNHGVYTVTSVKPKNGDGLTQYHVSHDDSVDGHNVVREQNAELRLVPDTKSLLHSADHSVNTTGEVPEDSIIRKLIDAHDAHVANKKSIKSKEYQF